MRKLVCVNFLTFAYELVTIVVYVCSLFVIDNVTSALYGFNWLEVSNCFAIIAVVYAVLKNSMCFAFRRKQGVLSYELLRRIYVIDVALAIVSALVQLFLTIVNFFVYGWMTVLSVLIFAVIHVIYNAYSFATVKNNMDTKAAKRGGVFASIYVSLIALSCFFELYFYLVYFYNALYFVLIISLLLAFGALAIILRQTIKGKCSKGDCMINMIFGIVFRLVLVVFMLIWWEGTNYAPEMTVVCLIMSSLCLFGTISGYAVVKKRQKS